MTPRSWLSARRPEGDDGVAILMAMAYIGIFTMLMLSMLAVVVQQVKPTAQARKDAGAVNAAASGLQAALATLRSSVDANGAGARGELPCVTGRSDTTTFRTTAGATTKTESTPGGTMAGTAATLPGNFRYRVDIAYFTQDPSDQDAAWLKANAKACPLVETPLFAYLQSYGTGDNIAGAGGSSGSRGNRSQTGVYRFNVPSENIAGGRLRSYGQVVGGKPVCLDAGSSPGPGTALSFKTCTDAPSAAQTWEYREDLSIFWGGNPSRNLCVQASSSQTPQLQTCAGTGYGSTGDRVNSSTYVYPPGQQVQSWSFNDNGHFAAASNTGDVSNSCLEPQSTGLDQALVLRSCTGGTQDYQAFDPDPAVGAGKAGGNISGMPGSPTRQYVNFAQFGRCLDITGQQVTATYLIAYPCKQAPETSRLTYNQVWSFIPLETGSRTGTFRTRTPTNDGKGGTKDTDYCLTAPASGNKPTVTKCPVGPVDTPPPVPASQQWDATGLVPGNASRSYNLVSKLRNQCLSVSLTEKDYNVSKIILETCDGSTKQRWNSPPPPPTSGLNNIKEGVTPR